MEKKFHIEVMAEPKNLIVIRNFFMDAAKGNLPREDMLCLQFCLNEVCENIVRHGYEKGKYDVIDIKMQFDNKEAKVIVRDKGKPFNMLEYKPMDMEKIVEKGIKGKLGIRAIRATCDRIHYKRVKDENQLLLVKKVGKKS